MAEQGRPREFNQLHREIRGKAGKAPGRPKHETPCRMCNRPCPQKNCEEMKQEMLKVVETIRDQTRGEPSVAATQMRTLQEAMVSQQTRMSRVEDARVQITAENARFEKLHEHGGSVRQCTERQREG